LTRNGVKNMIYMDGRSPSGFTSSDYTGYNYTPPSPSPSPTPGPSPTPFNTIVDYSTVKIKSL